MARAAFARGRDWADLTRLCLAQLDGAAGHANLGMVFMADPIGQMADDVLRHLRRETGIDNWFGASGLSVFCGGTEISGEPGLVVMLLGLPGEGFRVFSDVEGAAVTGAGSALLHLARDAHALDLSCVDGPSIVGGRPASDQDTTQIAGIAGAGGRSGILFGPPIEATAAMLHGACALGPWRRVTSALGGRVLELDSQPATEMLTLDAGEILARVPEQLVRKIMVETADTPTEEVDGGRMIMLDGYDEHAGAIHARAERVGAWLRVTHRDAPAALDEARLVATGLVAEAKRSPLAAVFYSSVERGTTLFGPAVNEVALVQSALGPVPLVGIRTSNELFSGQVTSGSAVLCLIG